MEEASIVSMDGSAPGPDTPTFGNNLSASWGWTLRSNGGATIREAVGRVVLVPGDHFEGAISASNATGEQTAMVDFLE